MGCKRLLSLVLLSALFVFLHAPRAESFFSSGFSFSAGSGTIGASGSSYSGSSWSSVSSSSGTASGDGGSVSVFTSMPVIFNSVSEAEGVLSPEILSVLNGIGQEESINAVTVDSGLAALVGGEDILQSLLLQDAGNTVSAQKVTTRHTNGVQYKEVTKFSELLNADAGDSDFQIYSVKGLPLYSIVYADSEEWENAFERIEFFDSGYSDHTIGEIISKEEAENVDFCQKFRALAENTETIAAFFTKADEEDITLKAEEVKLRETLLDFGLLESKDGTYTTPEKVAIVTIDPENINDEDDVLKIYKHEISHTFFATSETYKNEMTEVWNGLTVEAQEEIKDFLIEKGYCVDNEIDVINEFAAQCLSHRWFSSTVNDYGDSFIEIFEDKFADYF